MGKRSRVGDVALDLNIDEIRQALDDHLDEAMFLGGQEILEAAKPKTPYRVGKLRESGYVSTIKRTSYAGGKGHRGEIKPKKRGESVIAFSWFTARFFEVGTRRLAARPFLRPGFDERKDSAADTIVAVLRQGLEKA